MGYSFWVLLDRLGWMEILNTPSLNNDMKRLFSFFDCLQKSRGINQNAPFEAEGNSKYLSHINCGKLQICD